MTSNIPTPVNEEDIDQSFVSNGHYAQYTQEQKIVSAVWVHERNFNFQTMEDIRNNFRIRFKMAPPKHHTLLVWERRLFSEGTLLGTSKKVKPILRLKYIPYIKASFREEPNLTITERANKLGLSKSNLRRIIKYDLKESDMVQKSEKSDEENSDGVETIKTEEVSIQ